MRVLFIYSSWNAPLAYSEGVGLLSARLKRAGHETKLLYIHEGMYPLHLEGIKREVEEYQPGLIAFSTGTNQYPIVTQISRFLRPYLSIPFIVGGVHSTLCPEEVIKETSIDILCLGEGEEAIVELTERLESGEDITRIRNLWVKRDGQVFKNPPRPYQNLDHNPFADRKVFAFQKLIDLKNGWVDMMAGRGCPYLCTFCFNESYRKIYRSSLGADTGGYIRFRKPSLVIQEMKEILASYQCIKTFSFNDDTFTMSKRWLTEFCSLYKEEIKVPFVINSHLNNVEEDALDVLKDAGCELVRVGIESGNPRIRNDVLKRHPISNEEIVDLLGRIQSRGIRVLTYNMIGLPTERKEDIIETIRLNARCSPDVVKILTFYPYKNTPIYDFCLRKGLLRPDHEELPNYYEKTVLNFDQETKDFIQDVQTNFCRYLNEYVEGQGIRYEQKFAPYFAVKVKEDLSEQFEISLKKELI